MATARAHVHLDVPADQAWVLVRDVGAVHAWYPGLASCVVDGSLRHIVTDGGLEIDEQIVTIDDSLRRLQYRLLPGPFPAEHHLTTIDVLDGRSSTECVVVCTTEILPDELREAMQGAAEGSLDGLRSRLELEDA